MPLPRFVLLGRLVTMDPRFTVLDDGALEVDGGRVVGLRPATDPPSPGFEDVPRIRADGTVFPGLVELHNHLSYDALPLWSVPDRFGDRDQWSSGRVPEYRKFVTGPMAVLGRREALLGPIARYVETKALLGGTTTSQGLGLAAAGGSIRRFYRGLVRNVEDGGVDRLPAASTRISDVPASEAASFAERLRSGRRILLHLAEGIGDRPRRHFLDLHLPDDSWALGPTLVGIHAAALTAEDFAVLAEHGVGIVWSPLSNLLLYGGTADVAAARAARVRIAVGADWSPSGSKNLLGELKAARAAAPPEMTDAELVAAATRVPAELLGWDGQLGSLTVGARADLLVLDDDRRSDPYRSLLGASEADLGLVMIGGVARAGRPALLRRLGAVDVETVRIGGRERALDLADPDSDPLVAGVTLAAATDALRDALGHLPELAREDERRPPRLRDDGWHLDLDHEPADPAPPPLLPSSISGGFVPAQVAPPLSTVLEPMAPDPLTAAGDGSFRATLARERNLPADVRDGLLAAYR